MKSPEGLTATVRLVGTYGEVGRVQSWMGPYLLRLVGWKVGAVLARWAVRMSIGTEHSRNRRGCRQEHDTAEPTVGRTWMTYVREDHGNKRRTNSTTPRSTSTSIHNLAVLPSPAQHVSSMTVFVFMLSISPSNALTWAAPEGKASGDNANSWCVHATTNKGRPSQ